MRPTTTTRDLSNPLQLPTLPLGDVHDADTSLNLTTTDPSMQAVILRELFEHLKGSIVSITLRIKSYDDVICTVIDHADDQLRGMPYTDGGRAEDLQEVRVIPFTDISSIHIW